ncbi:MAG: ATP-binding protein, partial [Phycisphaerae bacterium]|nr:ATP-binding protein [Phycisphaerae bacterium]
LQTPLRSIAGFVGLLQRRYAGKLDEQADRWIARAVDGTERMQTLIRDLLTYSRVDSRSRPFEPVDTNQAFENALALLEASIEDAGAEVTSDPLPTVYGDASQLVQLLQNLIGNGLKYHGEAAAKVHVSARRQGEEWEFSVRDNGIGIAPEHQERIFEILRRLHSEQEYPGTGIGLAVCRRVVQRHGGRIWVESEPGKGSDFRFTMPVGATEPC